MFDFNPEYYEILIISPFHILAQSISFPKRAHLSFHRYYLLRSNVKRPGWSRPLYLPVFSRYPQPEEESLDPEKLF